MGSCLSVREDEQHRESNSSSKKQGVRVDSTSPMKSGSVGSNTIVIISKDIKDLRQSPANGDVDIFTYEEIKVATKNFRPDQVLGNGGFGIVYKGVIDENVRPGYKTTQVAIKVLDPESLQEDREWLSCSNSRLVVPMIGRDGEQDNRQLYALLHVSLEASDEEIRKAYRQWAQVYHPDKYQTLRVL